MNNNFRFDNYGYPDMNSFNNTFLTQSNQSTNQMNQPNDQMIQITNQMNQPNNQMNQISNQMSQNQELAEPFEGFLRGNLFNSLYDQYKNYRPAKLVPSNEQAELLLNVNQLSFATHELNLYLDVYPNDTQMIELFNHYRSMANEAIERYESKYGPLTIDAMSNADTFSWEAYSWPWEMEEM